jgi:proteasome lid subunit RPN8/RPN11
MVERDGPRSAVCEADGPRDVALLARAIADMETPNVFRLPKSAHEAMVRRAEADWPAETCGFVFGHDDELEVVPMENIQNRLHAEDPALHPRDARTAYYFDPTEMQRIIDEKERAGVPFRAIYHSHPEHDAYFSAMDSEAAATFGEPNFPGVVFLVYSVRQRRSVDWKAFDWDAARAAFREIPVELIETPPRDEASFRRDR